MPDTPTPTPAAAGKTGPPTRATLATRLTVPTPHGLSGTTTAGYLRDLMFNLTGRTPDDRKITFAENYAEVAGS